MRLRPYIHTSDHSYLEKWIDSERVHALWCANLIPYPMSEEDLRNLLEKDAQEWGGHAYVATEGSGIPVGFLVYSVNSQTNSAFLKFVILTPALRGKGYGRQMIKLVLEHIFKEAKVSSVQLNVFDVNDKAKACYESIGFIERSVEEGVFEYKNEKWGRRNMVISQKQFISPYVLWE
ncbi:MAG: GNAT family N-acetyltransferase [Acetatifactor sp.]|nr:GNAT family N-acetyltransferase [Acetatifactor sp.]